VNLHVISFFRNTPMRRVREYMERVARLRDVATGTPVSLVAVYGDSDEQQVERLQMEADAVGLNPILCEFNHGGRVFGSVEDKQRFAQLSALANAGLDRLAPFVDDHDAVWYVESDLRWEPRTVGGLMTLMRANDVDAIAPLILDGKRFYDTWAFRTLDDTRFDGSHPYHRVLKREQVVEMSSVGSAFLMRGYVAKNVRIKDNNALVGFWAEARRQGYRVWATSLEQVQHPPIHESMEVA
jgi:hypothetical protein